MIVHHLNSQVKQAHPMDDETLAGHEIQYVLNNYEVTINDFEIANYGVDVKSSCGSFKAAARQKMYFWANGRGGE